MTVRQLCNLVWFILAEGRDEKQLEELTDRIFRPLELDTVESDTDRARRLLSAVPITVVGA